jgi:hypothetical protein
MKMLTTVSESRMRSILWRQSFTSVTGDSQFGRWAESFMPQYQELTVFCFRQTMDPSVTGQLPAKSVTPPNDETMTNKSGVTARTATRCHHTAYGIRDWQSMGTTACVFAKRPGSNVWHGLNTMDVLGLQFERHNAEIQAQNKYFPVVWDGLFFI